MNANNPDPSGGINAAPTAATSFCQSPTDNVKPRKSSAFKSNFDLSVARAKAVETIIAPQFKDASRITVDGKGEDEPIADNATPEGRARNRRVDVMIPREETL